MRGARATPRALRLVLLGACTALMGTRAGSGCEWLRAESTPPAPKTSQRRPPPPPATGALRAALRGGGAGMSQHDAANLARANLEIGMEMEDMAVRRRRFIRDETQVLDYFQPKEAAPAARKPRAGRRAAGRMTEREEDEALLRRTEEEEAGATLTQKMERLLPLTTQPSLLQGGTLRDYQLEGLNWMASLYVNGASGILADEMGLGKTVQTVAMLSLLMQCGAPGPFLVLAPKSTLCNWASEFAKWLPQARVLLLQGAKDERRALVDDMLRPGNFDVVLTSYEMMLRESGELTKRYWRYVAIDEAHRIKNEESVLSVVARQLKTNGRLLITGTPLQNNLHELWALLNFVLPDEFHSVDDFLNFFTQSQEGQGQEGAGEGGGDGSAEGGGGRGLAELQGLLAPLMLRRVKQDVERTLLPKVEINVYLPLSSMQQALYASVLKKDVALVSGTDGDKGRLLNMVMQLRKSCNHPYLFQGLEPGPPYVEGEHLVYNAGKMRALDALLRKLKAQDSRVLIFSQMTRMLDIIQDYCVFRNYSFCRIDGQTVGAERQQQISDFQRPNSDKFLFLLSTRAGGQGVNLQTADKVVLYDSDWNPQMDVQAMDRAHRIGQKKQVVVYRLLHEATIEEKVVERALSKLSLDTLLIKQGLSGESQTAPGAKTARSAAARRAPKSGLGKQELLDMIRFGADAVVRNASSLSALSASSSSYPFNSDNLSSVVRVPPAQTQAGADAREAQTGGAGGAGGEAGQADTDIDIDRLLADGASRTASLHASVLDKATFLSSLTLTSGKSTGWDRTKDRLFNSSHSLAQRHANSSHAEPDAADTAADAFYLDLGKRRRAHVSGFYNEDVRFRAQLRNGETASAAVSADSSSEDAGGGTSGKHVNAVKIPRNLSCPQLLDYMLIDAAVVTTLYRRKQQAWLDAHAALLSEEQVRKLRRSIAASGSRDPNDGDLDSRNLDHGAGLNGSGAAAAPGDGGWSEAQEELLQRSLAEGFLDWTQRDLVALRHSVLRHGGRRASVAVVQRALPHRPPEQVAQYLKAFWDRGPRMLRSWPVFEKQLDEVERQRVKHVQTIEFVRKKLAKVRAAGEWKWRTDGEPLVVFRKSSERRPWTAAEDAFILSRACAEEGDAAEGFTDWTLVSREGRYRAGLKFDWFFRSRVPLELSHRFKSLARFIQREEDGEAADSKNKKLDDKGGARTKDPKDPKEALNEARVEQGATEEGATAPEKTAGWVVRKTGASAGRDKEEAQNGDAERGEESGRKSLSCSASKRLVAGSRGAKARDRRRPLVKSARNQSTGRRKGRRGRAGLEREAPAIHKRRKVR